MIDQQKSSFTLPYTMETEWTAYLILCIVMLPVAFCCSVIVWKQPSQWLLLLLFLGLFAFIYSRLRGFSITLNHDSLTYRAPGAPQRSVPYRGITGLTVSVGEQSRKSGFYLLKVQSASEPEPLLINMKPFSKQDLVMLMTIVTSMNQEVTMDDTVAQLRASNFGPMQATGIKRQLKAQAYHAIAKIVIHVLWALLAGFLGYVILRLYR